MLLTKNKIIIDLKDFFKSDWKKFLVFLILVVFNLLVYFIIFISYPQLEGRTSKLAADITIDSYYSNFSQVGGKISKLAADIYNSNFSDYEKILLYESMHTKVFECLLCEHPGIDVNFKIYNTTFEHAFQNCCLLSLLINNTSISQTYGYLFSSPSYKPYCSGGGLTDAGIAKYLDIKSMNFKVVEFTVDSKYEYPHMGIIYFNETSILTSILDTNDFAEAHECAVGGHTCMKRACDRSRNLSCEC
jgi:hypothetical protein